MHHQNPSGCAPAPSADRLYEFPELKSVWGIPYTRQHLLRLEKAGKFPKRVTCGARVLWEGRALKAWVDALTAAARSPSLAA